MHFPRQKNEFTLVKERRREPVPSQEDSPAKEPPEIRANPTPLTVTMHFAARNRQPQENVQQAGRLSVPLPDRTVNRARRRA